MKTLHTTIICFFLSPLSIYAQGTNGDNSQLVELNKVKKLVCSLKLTDPETRIKDHPFISASVMFWNDSTRGEVVPLEKASLIELKTIGDFAGDQTEHYTFAYGWESPQSTARLTDNELYLEQRLVRDASFTMTAVGGDTQMILLSGKSKTSYNQIVHYEGRCLVEY